MFCLERVGFFAVLKRRGWNAVTTCMRMEISSYIKSHLFQMCAQLRCATTLSWTDTGSNNKSDKSPKWFKVTLEHFSSIILKR